MAYSPIEQGRLAGHPVLARIGERHAATPAQVALAWVLRREGVAAIPKAGSPAHVRENRDALLVHLTEQDLAALDRAFPPPRGPQPLAVLDGFGSASVVVGAAYLGAHLPRSSAGKAGSGPPPSSAAHRASPRVGADTRRAGASDRDLRTPLRVARRPHVQGPASRLYKRSGRPRRERAPQITAVDLPPASHSLTRSLIHWQDAAAPELPTGRGRSLYRVVRRGAPALECPCERVVTQLLAEGSTRLGQQRTLPRDLGEGPDVVEQRVGGAESACRTLRVVGRADRGQASQAGAHPLGEAQLEEQREALAEERPRLVPVSAAAQGDEAQAHEGDGRGLRVSHLPVDHEALREEVPRIVVAPRA